MIRRSRISVRPNVKPAGRTLTAAPASGEGSEVTVGSSLPERTNPEDAQRSCSDLQDNTGHEHDGSSEPQRRKHFGAPPTLASTSETTGSSEAKPDLLTPRARVSRRPSGGSGQAQDLHSRVTGPTQEPLEQRAEDTEEPRAKPEVDTPCSQPPPTEAREKVPEPADSARLHPVRDGTKLQSASTILSSLSGPADVLRLAQARRLRDLLKMEMNKDKVGRKKSKMDIKQRKKLKDHTKMTMKELIYYLPSANPMRSFSEEEAGAATAARTPETLLSDSHTPPSSLVPATPDVQEEEAAEREEAVEQTQEEEPSLGPRVKVAEDGSLIIDEESLTIQVSRTNGPNLAEENDPIFERGSTTTYSSFRKGSYTKPWSSGETEMFFLAISMVGTDFSMIGQLFPHRARLEIKNKFKKEERRNSWRIDKAFKEKRRLDLKFFQTLMEQMLKEEKLKKGKKRQVKERATVRRRAREIYTSTEESDSDVITGEKENKDVWNDGDSAATAQKKKIAYVKKRRKPRRNRTLEEAELPADRWTEREASGATSRAGTKSEAPRPSPDISRRPQQASPSEEPVSSEHDEELDLMAVREQIFNKPTRSGRIPKLSQHVMPSADEEEEEDEEEDEEEVTAAPGHSGNHSVSRTGKSRLLTLLASVDEDEEEQEEEWEEFSNPEDENQAFVPLSLRRQPAVNPELEETMEELDISVPGVLCSELSCDQSRPEPSDHQLDLLVDVIEYLDPDHMEVCQELNTEAAETLLTIGSSVIQTGTGVEVENNEDSSYFVPEDVAQEEVVTETIEEQGVGGSDGGACPSEDPPALLLESQPPPKRGRFSKPKPNISRISRARPVAPPPEEARPPPSLSPRDTGDDVPQIPSVMIESVKGDEDVARDCKERAAPLDDSAQEAAAEGGGAQELFIPPVADGGEDLSTNLQVAADGGTAGSAHGQEEHLERSGRRARLQVKPKLPLRRKTAAEGDAAALPVKETTQKLSSSTSADMSAGAQGDSGTISRPGRRPKGFLSFISSNPTQAAPRGPRTKPAVSAARPVRKREAVSVPQSSDETASVSKFLFSDIFTQVEEVDVD